MIKKLAEKFSPFTKTLDEVNESTEKVGEVVEKPEVEVGIHTNTSYRNYSRYSIIT